jgi:hypothetical protein
MRELMRRELASSLEGLPEAPSWEELRTAADAKPGRARRWFAIVGATAVVAILAVSMMLVDGTDPAMPGTAAESFDAVAAAYAGEEWWLAVIADDLAQARSIAHPDGDFNYVGLRQLVAGLTIESVAIGEDVFGTELQPQLCYAVTGANGVERTGSLVFRRYKGQWLLWEARTNTERCATEPGIATPTTASTTTAPVQPASVSDLPLVPTVLLRVLAVRFNNPSLAVLDFEAKTMTVYPPYAHALPLDAVDGAVAAPNGDLIIWTQGVARLFTDTLAVVHAELGADPVREIEGIAPSLRVVPSPDGEVAWLVQPGIAWLDPVYPTLVELVELPSGRHLASYELDPNAFPIGATAAGLIFNLEDLVDTGDGWVSGPGSQVLHLQRDGIVMNLFPGRAIAVTSSAVVTLDGSSLVIGSVDGESSRDLPMPVPGEWSEVGGPGGPSDAMPLHTVTTDGSQFLIAIADSLDVNRVPRSSTLFSIDLETGVASMIAELPGGTPLATWSRDGEWIMLVRQQDIELIRRSDPTDRFLLPGVVPADHWVLAAG